MSKPSVMSTRSWRRFIAPLIAFWRVRMVRSRVHLLEPWQPATATLPSASMDPRKHLFSLDGIVRSAARHAAVRARRRRAACWVAARIHDSQERQLLTGRGMECNPGQPLNVILQYLGYSEYRYENSKFLDRQTVPRFEDA